MFISQSERYLKANIKMTSRVEGKELAEKNGNGIDLAVYYDCKWYNT
jgi:hypothetical protein